MKSVLFYRFLPNYAVEVDLIRKMLVIFEGTHPKLETMHCKMSLH